MSYLFSLKSSVFTTPLFLGLLLTSPAWSEPLSPPEGARLVGSNTNVRLNWGGPSGEYDLQVQVGGRTIYSNHGKGNSEVVKMPPNGGYFTWTVTRRNAVAESHTFQLSQESSYNFDGARGASGVEGDGPVVNGRPGQAGQAVNVLLAPAGDFFSVRIEGLTRKAQFLLIPGSSPVDISARGGEGGQGARGQDGYAASISQTGYAIPAQPGQPGGEGGDGGPGGQVVIRSSLPPDAPPILQIHVDGGRGGKGGPGGQGGAAVSAVSYPANGSMATSSYASGAGAPGARGRDGREGSPGTINSSR